ncbi:MULTISPECIES: fatty acyl-AMP ligase [unclassified Streptomyces]|uniref:fatty acyl-AMP ligase n=1 Tax=unclassified Streptomyces TaxID=2593676 RepID=UPI0009396369|nr:fatty acyl-AMP ligase [Streptomyces sp. TSRI0107]OKJ90842.1 polyketide synthase [Streptomyces sp. TSRI0107]
MSDYRTFTELMLARAEEAPERAALLLLPDSDDRGRPATVSYRTLDASARRLAGRLQADGVAGEPVLLLHASRRQFAVSFLACLYAGAVAVPVPPYGGRSHHEERVAGIVRQASPRAALTDAALAPDISRLLARHGHGSIPCLAADAAHASTEWRLPPLDRDTPAYLQFTSGSTGCPHGVVVTHGNLLANQEALAGLLGAGPGSRIGGWLPFHHDMGLVGQLLHPLWLGATAAVLSPEAFVRRPARWLEAIGRYGIEVSGAPDFAYDLCVRRVTDEQLAGLDLSGWRVAVSGGEPVRAETRRAFVERFAGAGLRPEAMHAAYGLAEATLLVSGGPAGAGERTVDADALEKGRLSEPQPGRPTHTLVSCGTAAGAAGRVLVVDPESRQVLPDGEVGEIWVSGPGVADGYWRDRSATTERFGAVTADGATGLLRTGDLGVLDDGRLYVTGRLKDVIVIAGRNLYPQDLERTVQRVSTLFGTGSAFSVPGERERVVVVQELRTHQRYTLDLEELAKNVRRCLTEEFEVAVAGVLLVRPGTVRRTTSGKVERAAMRRLFLNGGLRPVYQYLDDDLVAPAGPHRRTRS